MQRVFTGLQHYAARPWHGDQHLKDTSLTGTFLGPARALAINFSCFYRKEIKIPET